MAKKPENVQIFLDDLTEKLKKLLDCELDVLLKYKKEEVCIFSIIKEKIFYKKNKNLSVSNLKYPLMEKSINRM
jgi:hypothetical protein